jgi:hypothetical protein
MRREGGLQKTLPQTLTMGLDERMHILAAHNAALLRHKMFEPMDDVRIDRANGLCCIGIAQRPFTLWNANGQDSHVFAGIALSFRAPLGRLGLWGGAARALLVLDGDIATSEAKSASSLTEV